MPDINSQNEKLETTITSVDKACIQEYTSLTDKLVDLLILV